MKFSTSTLLLISLLPIASALRANKVTSRQLSKSALHSLRGFAGGQSTILSNEELARQESGGGLEVDVGDIDIGGSEPEDDDTCDIAVVTACVPPAGLEEYSCETLPAIRTECTAAPTSLTLRFNGDACDASATVQPDVCIDHDAPSLLPGAQAYIIVRDAATRSRVYSGVIQIEDAINLEAEDGGVLPASLVIDIYSSASPQNEFLVQTVTFDSSCDENTLFLHDSFGGVSLIAYENAEQSESTVIQAETEITIINLLDDTSVTIEDAAAITTIGRVDLNEDIQRDGNIILGGGSMVVNGEPIEIDLSLLRQYNTLTTVQGRSPAGYVCRGTATDEFIAGPLYS